MNAESILEGSAWKCHPSLRNFVEECVRLRGKLEKEPFLEFFEAVHALNPSSVPNAHLAK